MHVGCSSSHSSPHARGLSLSQFLGREYELIAVRARNEAIFDRAVARGGSPVTTAAIVAEVRALRDADDR
jgi:hypothetical protein